MNPKSTKGHATKARILDAAVALVYSHGATATSVDDILKASGTGKSQFYHYFRNKDHLLAEVIAVQQRNFPGRELDQFNFAAADGIPKWLDAVRADHLAGRYPHGCPIGNLASELANGPPELRDALNQILGNWHAAIAKGLKTQKLRGFLKPTADPDEIAHFIIATVQGAFLLAKTQGGILQLDASINQIKAYLKQTGTRAPGQLGIPKQTSIGFCP